MLVLDDGDDVGPPAAVDPEQPLKFLHGLWRDEVRGSTICIDARSGRPHCVYCSGGDHEFTGRYTWWEFQRGQFFARFAWQDRQFSGVVVLQPQSQNILVGGWWYDRDLTQQNIPRLPFVPGVNPCRWIRQDPRKPWPLWAAAALRLPTDGSVTSASLAAENSAHSVALRPAPTSEGRYRQRLDLWTTGRRGLARIAGRLAHHGWWLLHNLVAHPVLALVTGRPAVALHDWTSRHLNRDIDLEPSPSPQIDHRFWWLVHNLAAHPAIGLVPCATTFRWHDLTARRMRVPNWA